jgi:hypothetical protein
MSKIKKLTTYTLTDVQRDFINVRIPRKLYDKYNRYGVLNHILHYGEYNLADRIILKKMRIEYIENILHNLGGFT